MEQQQKNPIVIINKINGKNVDYRLLLLLDRIYVPNEEKKK